MKIYAARKINTDLYLNTTGMDLVPLSGAAKLNSFNVIENKLKRFIDFRQRRLNLEVNQFEIVEFDLVENISVRLT